MHTHLLSSKVAENTCHIFSDVKMQRISSHFYISFCATSEYLQQSSELFVLTEENFILKVGTLGPMQL